jgi:serine protease
VLAAADTDLIIDINGYFGPLDPTPGYEFHAVTPCRVMDTRTDKVGPFGAPALVGNASRDIPILASGCGIPSTAVAYSLNFTAVPKGFLGYLAAWPAGMARPNVSTLNAWDGLIAANAAVVPAGAGGAISVLAAADTDLIIDINGYFGP